MHFCGRDYNFSLASVLFLFHIVGTCAGSVRLFHHDKGFDDLLPTTITQRSPANSEVQCGRLCQAEKWCNSFFYSYGKASCALQRMVYRGLWSNQTVAAPGWRYYSLTSERCPSQGDYVIDRVTAFCYRLVTSPILTWRDARAACNSSNERLVVLEPVEKARFIQDFLNTNIALHEFDQSIHIGASRPAAEWDQPLSPAGLQLEWIDGQTMDLNATRPFWRKDPTWKNTTENFLILLRDHRYLWGFPVKNYKRDYICEQPY